MPTHDERREPLPGLTRRLRREARGERPAFSPEFQARLERRLEASPRRPAPPAGPARPAWRRPFAAFAAGLAVVAGIAALTVVLPGIEPGPLGGVRPGAGEGAAVALVAELGQASAGGEGGELPPIVVLPLYHEIEAGLRDGVRTLAESFVELPDWASLAEFDAAALLGAAIGPDAIGPE
jgi:hypothetical protein